MDLKMKTMDCKAIHLSSNQNFMDFCVEVFESLCEYSIETKVYEKVLHYFYSIRCITSFASIYSFKITQLCLYFCWCCHFFVVVIYLPKGNIKAKQYYWGNRFLFLFFSFPRDIMLITLTNKIHSQFVCKQSATRIKVTVHVFRKVLFERERENFHHCHMVENVRTSSIQYSFVFVANENFRLWCWTSKFVIPFGVQVTQYVKIIDTVCLKELIRNENVMVKVWM